MRLSTQRISHLAHLILDDLRRQELIEVPDAALALAAAKESLTSVLSVDDEVDALVRRQLARQQKVPGSREWQILYDKYFRAEMEKRKW